MPQQFSGMSTGTTLGKGLEEAYKNKKYLKDIELLSKFIANNTGYCVSKISANPKSATIILRAKSYE
jgi:hypothetical protein